MEGRIKINIKNVDSDKIRKKNENGIFRKMRTETNENTGQTT